MLPAPSSEGNSDVGQGLTSAGPDWKTSSQPEPDPLVLYRPPFRE
jgi:hypothetical protein